MEWGVYVLAIVYVADEFQESLDTRYVSEIILGCVKFQNHMLTWSALKNSVVLCSRTLFDLVL